MVPSNVSIRARSVEIIEFLYPDYQLVHQYSPLIEGGVIYDGDAKYLQMFRDNNIPYIYVKGTPEYDLTVPERFLEFVYMKWDKQPPKYMVEYLDTLDYKKRPEEVELILKQIWITGKSSITESEKVGGFYEALAKKSPIDIMSMYLEMSDKVNNRRLFYQIQSFLKATTNPEGVSKTWLRRYVDVFNHGQRNKLLEHALFEYLYTNAENEELKMIKLLIALSEK